MNNYNRKLIIVLVVGACLFINMMAICSRDCSINPGEYAGTIRLSGNHAPISIDGNDELDAFCAGNGTNGSSWAYAHVLQDFIIDAGGASTGISLKNTDKYVVIQNCTVSDFIGSGCAGIKLENCTNVNVTNCTLLDNGLGIYVEDSSSDYIKENSITGNVDAGIYLEGSSNISVTSNNCTGNDNNGIYLYNADDNTIAWNNASDNDKRGLRISLSAGNNISMNNITGNYLDGMKLDSSDGNMVHGNTFKGNRISGCHVDQADNNTLSQNVDSNSDCTFFIRSCEYNNFTGNAMTTGGFFMLEHAQGAGDNYIDQTNTVNGIAVYFANHTSDTEITGTWSQIILVNCTNMTVTQESFSNVSCGVLLMNSSDNEVSYCNISDNGMYGIFLADDSNDNNISLNEISSAGDDGIIVLESAFNEISYNNASLNGDDGIHLSYSNNNSIYNNTASNNSKYGIGLAQASHNNTIENNSLVDNHNTGLSVYELCLDNILSQNNDTRTGSLDVGSPEAYALIIGGSIGTDWAEKFYDLMVDEYKIKESNIRFLMPGNNSAKEIEEQFENITASIDLNDKFFFYVTEHGSMTGTLLFNYFSCYRYSSTLNFDEEDCLQERLDAIACGEQYCFVDTCHAGSYNDDDAPSLCLDNRFLIAVCNASEEVGGIPANGFLEAHVDSNQGFYQYGDSNTDGVVTLNEAFTYMENYLMEDHPVLSDDIANDEQNPVDIITPVITNVTDEFSNGNLTLEVNFTVDGIGNVTSLHIILLNSTGGEIGNYSIPVNYSNNGGQGRYSVTNTTGTAIWKYFIQAFYNEPGRNFTHDSRCDGDNDGLTDFSEFTVHGTNCLSNDTDSDGMPDGWEVENSLDPLSDDSTNDGDSDNLVNIYEYTNSTDPNNNDTDYDDLLDGDEIVNYTTDPLLPDTDDDGLNDGEEILVYSTNATNNDTDGDNSIDGLEIIIETDPNDASSNISIIFGDIDLNFSFHDCISINNDNGWTEENGVTGGNGTEENPYIIEGWVFSSNTSINKVYIKNNKHFILRYCIFNLSWGDVGIFTYSSTSNGKVQDNYITSLSQDRSGTGISIFSCGNNTVESNTIKNTATGIYLMNANNNTFCWNNISAVTKGIHIGGTSENNSFYLNYLNASTNYQSSSSGNSWDNGRCGNFWGNYETRYPSADQNGVFWKTPYEIYGSDADNYPLVEYFDELHEIISINGNSSLDDYCSGSGTNGTSWEDAYVIENMVIDGEDTDNGISISNTGKYLIIRNCTIFSSSPVYKAGISLTSCVNVNITECKIVNNYYGISLYNSDGNNVSLNNASDNMFGIYIKSSDSTVISKNTVSYNGYYGIFIYWYSLYNTVLENVMVQNDNGFGVSYYSEFNNVTGNEISNNTYGGIHILGYSHNTTITSNLALYNSVGIYASFSHNATITNNNFSYSSDIGMSFGDSDNNTVMYNNASYNENWGIYLEEAESNNVSYNNVSYNEDDGICLCYCDYNTISGNTINDNTHYGVYLFQDSDENNGHDNVGSGNGDGNYYEDGTCDNNDIQFS